MHHSEFYGSPMSHRDKQRFMHGVLLLRGFMQPLWYEMADQISGFLLMDS